MQSVARKGDRISGHTTGEHHGHYHKGSPVHGSGTLSGYIDGNCSSNVYINGIPAATVGSTTSESDNCGSGRGSISNGSSKVFINGKSLARKGDRINPHNGSASISSGSSNVFAG